MSELDRARAALRGTIEEIKEARRAATAELISYKAGAKLMAARAEALVAEVASWDQRAQQAVLAGDDDLAREALARRAEVRAELGRARAEAAEQSSYAAELLRSRRELDAALKRIELREGTVAAGLAAARSGGASPLATEGEVWDRMDEAERKIDEEAIAAELDGELGIEQAELARVKLGRLGADDALAALKEKMKGKGQGDGE